MQIEPLNILSVPVAPINLSIASEFLRSAAAQRRKGWVCVVSAHGIVEAQFQPEFRQALAGAFLNTSDGIPLVWYGRLHGYPQMERVYGPDLMLRLMEDTRDGALTHFLFGGAPGVAEKLKARLEERFPGVRIVGVHTPPYRPLNEAEIFELNALLLDLRPHFFWVGLGTPKQEVFMKNHCHLLDAGIMLGVGAAFDFHSGTVRQAPLWMRQRGLEWFYRLTREPRRLWKRYAVIVPLFAWFWLLKLTGLKKFPPIRTAPFGAWEREPFHKG